MARGEKWTEEDEDKLADLALEGKTAAEIGRILDRSVTAINMRFAEVVHRRTQWKALVDKLKENS